MFEADMTKFFHILTQKVQGYSIVLKSQRKNQSLEYSLLIRRGKNIPLFLNFPEWPIPIVESVAQTTEEVLYLLLVMSF